ncbi:MAG: hypothetical protein ABEI11_00420 [Haloarculaceae archaeon]
MDRQTPADVLPRPVLLALGLLTLPHELAHAAAMRPWTADVRVDLEPTRDERFVGRGLDRPLARFDAAVPLDTPPWAIRLCAVAPLPAFLAVAVVLDAVLGLAGVSSGTLVATAAVAYWASLSDGDMAVFLSPEEVIDAGAFVVAGVPRAATVASPLLTLATTVVVALVFLT